MRSLALGPHADIVVASSPVSFLVALSPPGYEGEFIKITGFSQGSQRPHLPCGDGTSVCAGREGRRPLCLSCITALYLGKTYPSIMVTQAHLNKIEIVTGSTFQSLKYPTRTQTWHDVGMLPPTSLFSSRFTEKEEFDVSNENQLIMLFLEKRVLLLYLSVSESCFSLLTKALEVLGILVLVSR